MSDDALLTSMHHSWCGGSGCSRPRPSRHRVHVDKRRQGAISRNDSSWLLRPSARTPARRILSAAFSHNPFPRLGQVRASAECLARRRRLKRGDQYIAVGSLAVCIIQCTCRNCSAAAHLLGIPIWWYRPDIARCEDRLAPRRTFPRAVSTIRLCQYAYDFTRILIRACMPFKYVSYVLVKITLFSVLFLDLALNAPVG